jgi:hypothetical protein
MSQRLCRQPEAFPSPTAIPKPQSIQVSPPLAIYASAASADICPASVHWLSSLLWTSNVCSPAVTTERSAQYEC